MLSCPLSSGQYSSSPPVNVPKALTIEGPRLLASLCALAAYLAVRSVFCLHADNPAYCAAPVRTMSGGNAKFTEMELKENTEYLRKTRWQVLCQPTAKQRCHGPILHCGRTAKDFSDRCPHKPQCIRIHGSDALRHHVHTDLVRLEIPKTKDAQDVVLRNFVLRQALQRELVGRSPASWWHRFR